MKNEKRILAYRQQFKPIYISKTNIISNQKASYTGGALMQNLRYGFKQ